MNELPCLGHNDATTVFCGLCEWTRAIASMEQAEHYLGTHLAEAHGLRTFYRVDDETGLRTEIPQ